MNSRFLPLAFYAALYPTLLAMVVLILRRPNPIRMLAAYLVGAMFVSLALGAAIVRALKAGNVVGGSDTTVGPGVDIFFGVVALGLVYGLRTGRDSALRERRERRKAARAKPERDPWSQRVMDRESLVLTFFVGIALSLPGIAYLTALKDIAASDDSVPVELASILVFNVIMFGMAEIPLIGYLVAPDWTRVRVNAFNEWLGRHARQIAIVLCGVTGAFLLTRGLVDALG
jgi:hypothetical protein